MESNEGLGVAFLISGVLIALVGGFYGLISSRMVTAKRIDDQYVLIKGAHPDYLAIFPQVGMPMAPGKHG